MKTIGIARLAGVCVSTIVISLMFAGVGYAKIEYEDCVGMWLLDEGKGKIAKDSSKEGNDGDILDRKWVNGKFGKALEFDGATTSVDIKLDVLDLNKDQSFTVWFKTKVNQDYHARVLNARFLGGYRLWLWIMRSGHGAKGKLGLGYRAADIGLEMTSAAPLNDGTWHHAAAVFDHKAKQAILYIDGARSTQKSIAGIDFNDSEGGLCIGSNCPGDTLPGEIDEVAIFNVALEEADIKAIMNLGLEAAVGGAAVESVGKLTAIWAAIRSQKY